MPGSYYFTGQAVSLAADDTCSALQYLAAGLTTMNATDNITVIIQTAGQLTGSMGESGLFWVAAQETTSDYVSKAALMAGAPTSADPPTSADKETTVAALEVSVLAAWPLTAAGTSASVTSALQQTSFASFANTLTSVQWQAVCAESWPNRKGASAEPDRPAHATGEQWRAASLHQRGDQHHSHSE